MLLTLATVIFFASIALFFSQEFVRIFKKIFAVKGVKLFLPLAVASWLVYNCDYWFLWIIYYCREVLNAALSFLTRLVPLSEIASAVALIFLLTLSSVVPVILLDLLSKRKTYKGYKYPYLTSTLIWIVCSVLLIAIK